MRIQPYLIGIAGPSCSGKSEVARRVAAELGASVVGLDSYYRDLADLPMERRVRVNFDAPESVDHGLLHANLERLASGRPIHKPLYDFAAYTRSGAVEEVPAAQFVVVEGLFALHWTEVRRLFRTKIYIDANHEVCFERRLARDVAERGRTPETVERQYRETVRPMCERYIVPTMHFADLTLCGTDSLDASAQRVLLHIEKQLAAKPRKIHAVAAFA